MDELPKTQPDNSNDFQVTIPKTKTQPLLLDRIRSFIVANKYLVLALSVLALGSLGSTAYILSTRNFGKAATTPTNTSDVASFPSPTITEAPTLTPSPTPTPNVELTADWKEYKNTKYLYSIKYPQTWIAKNPTFTDPKVLDYATFSPPEATSSAAITVSLYYKTLTYQEALAVDSATDTTITVSSVSATKKTLQDSNRNITIKVIVPHATRSAILLSAQKYESTFDLMLSTFKFL